MNSVYGAYMVINILYVTDDAVLGVTNNCNDGGITTLPAVKSTSKFPTPPLTNKLAYSLN
jgi:hypothetical protein